MQRKILFVDDDANLLAAFQRNFRNQFSFDTALGGVEALELIKSSGPYAVVLADMNMPGMNGVELLERVRLIAPDCIRLMLTGNADQQTAVDAVNRGAVYRFLNKPCPPDVLVPALEAGLKHFEILNLEREILEGTLTGTVKMLTEVLGMVAPDALGRGQKLQESMTLFAKHVNAGPSWELEVGALLASIGYASLPTRVIEKLRSGADRTINEERLVRCVPQIGHDLLVGIPRFAGVAKIVLFQHKSYDGNDIPAIRCSGEDIPIGARMLKILGDRMTLEEEGVVRQRAFETMKSRTGVYDPVLLDSCFVCFNAFLANPISSERPVRTAHVRDLVPGQIVVSDITTNDGILLIGAGNRLTVMVLRRLQNYELLGQVKQPILVQNPGP